MASPVASLTASVVASAIALSDHFIPADLARDSDAFRRARLLVLFGLAISFYGPIFAAAYWALGAPILAVGLCITVSLVTFSPFILRRTRSLSLAGNYSISTLAAMLLFSALVTGGVGSSGHYWGVSLPIVGLLLVGRRAGVGWTVFLVVETVVLYALPSYGRLPESLIVGERAAILHALGAATLGVLMLTLAGLYESIKDRMRGVLASTNSELRLILDNSGQGFLTISRDGLVTGERSAIVDEWLGKPAAGEPVWRLIGAVDRHAGFALELCWMQIADGVLPVEVAMMQLPTRIVRGEQHLELAYRPILQHGRFARMLLVISDVSAVVARERAERAEAELLALVKRLMADRSGFLDFFEEARQLCARISSPAAPAAEVLRDIHTLKGNCGLFGLGEVARACHQLEDAVAARQQAPTLEERQQLVAVWEESTRGLSSLFEGETPRDVELSLAEHAELLRLLDSGASRQRLAELAASWVHEPAARRLARLAEGARALSTRLGKPEVTVELSDHGVRVPREGWKELWAALVHLIRNAVDHGVEPAEQRVARGKPARGQLQLRTIATAEHFLLEVGDDGAGIDWEQVRARALALGLPAATEAELEEALFAEGLSTRPAASDISGRGVGMAVVRATCTSLGGTISVVSQPGLGTTFRLAIPRGVARRTPHQIAG